MTATANGTWQHRQCSRFKSVWCDICLRHLVPFLTSTFCLIQREWKREIFRCSKGFFFFSVIFILLCTHVMCHVICLYFRCVSSIHISCTGSAYQQQETILFASYICNCLESVSLQRVDRIHRSSFFKQFCQLFALHVSFTPFGHASINEVEGDGDEEG